MKIRPIIIILIILFVTGCKQKSIIKTHGISYLEKREKLMVLNKSNKNDVVKIFGYPATKGMSDDNLWIYIERTQTKGSILRLGKNYLHKNNVLILEFNKFGILKKKQLFDRNNMKDITFAKNITENEIRKENFIYSFLSSVRQKMQTKKK